MILLLPKTVSAIFKQLKESLQRTFSESQNYRVDFNDETVSSSVIFLTF